MEKTFAKRLKEERNKQNITQQQLADMVNNLNLLDKKISRNSITRYENNTRTPDIQTISAISTALDVNLYYLLGLMDVKNTASQQISSDLNELIKITESSNKEISDIVGQIVDKMYLTIFHHAQDGDIQYLKIIKDLYNTIWEINLMDKGISMNKLLETNDFDSLNAKDEIPKLINKNTKFLNKLIDYLQI